MRELKWAPGSIGVVDYVLASGEPALSANQRLIYLALFSRMGKGFNCYPKVTTLADGSGLSPRTVQRELKGLQQVGLIYMEPRYDNDGRQTSTLYRLRPPWDVIRLIGDEPGEGDSVTPQGDIATPAPDTVTPQERQGVILPVTEGHPGGDSLTPEVTHLSNPMKANEEASAPSAERLTWRKWYEKKFAGMNPVNEYTAVLDNAEAAGMESKVVIEALQRCLDTKKRYPLSAAATVVGNWVAAGVRTMIDLNKHESGQGGSVSDGRTGGPAPADGGEAAGAGTERGRHTPGRRESGGRRHGRPEPRGAADAATSQWVLPEHRG